MHGPPPRVGGQEGLVGWARVAGEQVTCRDNLDLGEGRKLAFNKMVKPLKVVKNLVGEIRNKPVDAV